MNSQTATLLQVPIFSQHDAALGINGEDKRLMCSMVCVKMLLSYFLPDSPAAQLNPAEIRQRMIDYGGKNPEGYWQHSTQVNIFKEYGLLSWRRNWLAPSNGRMADEQHFRERESYDNAQIEALRRQWQIEQNLPNIRSRAQACLIAALQNNDPVIISVKAGFIRNIDSHQVVLNGYDTNRTVWFSVVDPDTPVDENPIHWVSEDFFYDHFNYWAVFVDKPST